MLTKMMYPVWLFLLTASFPAATEAQRLSDLQQGVQVRVLGSEGGVSRGSFARVDSATISLVEPGGAVKNFQLAETSKVEVLSGKSRGRGMARYGSLAAVSGIGAGAILGAVTYKKCESSGIFDCFLLPDSRGQATLAGGLVGGVLGLVVGGVVGAIVGSDVWRPVSVR